MRSARGLAVAAILVFAVFAVAAHLALLWTSPRWETDQQIAAGLKHGAHMNTLFHGAVPKAASTSVPLANPDTLASRAYLDLSKDPLLLTGMRPDSCSYWSASVFAHNTDTVLIRSDRETPDRAVAIGLRTAGQTFGEPVRDQAVLPSPRGVLLIRCFMRNRMDQSYLAKLDAERRQLTLRPAAPGATR